MNDRYGDLIKLNQFAKELDYKGEVVWAEYFWGYRQGSAFIPIGKGTIQAFKNLSGGEKIYQRLNNASSKGTLQMQGRK